MSDSQEFLVARMSERERNILRVYSVAETSGELVIPRCVVALYGVPTPQSVVVSPEWTRRYIDANAPLTETLPEDIVSTSEDVAVEEVMRFMQGHLPSEEPAMSDDFIELFTEKHPELDALVKEKFGQQHDLHTGFYL